MSLSLVSSDQQEDGCVVEISAGVEWREGTLNFGLLSERHHHLLLNKSHSQETQPPCPPALPCQHIHTTTHTQAHRHGLQNEGIMTVWETMWNC